MKLTAEKETSVKSIERKSNHLQQNGDKGPGGGGGGGGLVGNISQELWKYTTFAFYVVIFLENSTACITELFVFVYWACLLHTRHYCLCPHRCVAQYNLPFCFPGLVCESYPAPASLMTCIHFTAAKWFHFCGRLHAKPAPRDRRQ